MAALGELANSIASMFSISCRFKCPHRIAIRDHETAVHLYRITQEAVHNAITHGKASQIVISLSRDSKGIVLSVKDNGRGLSKVSADRNGTGLENMNYRARGIGARIQLTSSDTGGTVMLCTLPRGNRRAK
jgi:signal transduction histidine kinase